MTVDDAIRELAEWPPRKVQRRFIIAVVIAVVILVAVASFTYIKVNTLRSDFRNEVNSRVRSVCLVSKHNRDKFVQFVFDLTKPTPIPPDTPPDAVDRINTANASREQLRQDTLAHFPEIKCSKKGQAS